MTHIKPLRADLPYPSLDGLTKDLYTARVLSLAYATQESELGAIMQYTYHSFVFSLFDEDCQKLVQSIVITEMMHLDMIGEALAKMGINPIFSPQPPLKNNFFTTETVAYVTDREKMLRANLEGELNAIAGYKKIVSLISNPIIIDLVNRIIMDEEVHVLQLQRALSTKSCCNE